MSSKSSGTVPWSSMNPRRRLSGLAGASSGRTFVIGLPALAMMDGSPAATWSTRRDRWVLAAWMLIVRIVGSLDQTRLVYCVVSAEGNAACPAGHPGPDTRPQSRPVARGGGLRHGALARPSGKALLPSLVRYAAQARK